MKLKPTSVVTPLASAASFIWRASSTELASGFSQ